MPSTATITAFTTFSAQTLAKSSEVNANFSNFRGHIIPIEPSTIAAGDAAYDLGETSHRWRDGYLSRAQYIGNVNVAGGWRIQQGATTTSLEFDLYSSTAYVNKAAFTPISKVETVVTKTANYTATISDDVILCDASGGSFTITLPAVSGNSGKSYTIVKTDGGGSLLLIDAASSESINGQERIFLSGQYETMKIICDGAAWNIISKFISHQVAYLKDIKAAGTGGGDFNSGAWRVRDFTTITGATTWLSLTSSRVTLRKGIYDFIADAPAFDVRDHKAKIRDINAATDTADIVGTSEHDNLALVTTRSTVKGRVEIATETAYELWHICQTTKAAAGFGESASFTTTAQELYSQWEIRKLL